ncbi:mandelate racemase/muconate lactonizing enzyme family protein [Variovorax saccharolyticus]|uniref:mandelate racemase/muconate lactonizing enzyme family protein n=1 Tax=Variovorax saccharolyticus TaxID=3053516 RepID=UPI0025772E30|nr:mandelate racemase/muconate lactonizing enzyme family protein [Variovorax sp. J22R187]MDM0019320.1 mandelate racemase/muconate lactonizing enzyme family protein [Variovorax sp. J22R187]
MTDAPPLPALSITLARLEAVVFRYPVTTPVRTSFGVMHDRPAVFVRAEDADGAVGWGEIWCNFPACGAEHRARLLDTVMAPLLLGQAFAGPAQAWATLTERTAVLAIQSGEQGPIAQTIAGIDLALWDLSARRAGQPLYRHLGGTRGSVPVYASGINPDQPERMALRRRDEGYRAFKLKIGFGQERDLANLDAMRRALGDDAELMADANQSWTLAEAQRMAPLLAPYALRWLEEPLRADRPWSDWQALKACTGIALAAGENIAGDEDFDAALRADVLSVLQPDAAKWGGISACLPVIRRAQAAGLRYCPHYLGAGVGLLASAHLLAAAGGDGLLEVDANDNPLRTEVAPALRHPGEDGRVNLGEAPGIGVEPDLGRISEAIRAAAG